jgi:hypothetical protein
MTRLTRTPGRHNPHFGDANEVWWVQREQALSRANPAKVEDFGDKDLLQDTNLARILFGEVIPLRRDAR